MVCGKEWKTNESLWFVPERETSILKRTDIAVEPVELNKEHVTLWARVLLLRDYKTV